MRSVFVLGDSISIQYGPFLRRFLTGSLAYARKEGEAEALRDLDKMQGANGGDSQLVLSYLREKQAAINSDYLLLNCGLHDIRVYPGQQACSVSIEEYADNLRSILALIQTMRPQPLWVTSTSLTDAIHNTRSKGFHRFARDIERYNAAATQIMHAAGVPVIDLCAFTLQLGGDEIYKDHVHYTEAVQQAQGAYLAGWLTAWDKQQQ